MNHVDTWPEIRELEDGSLGYFYTMQQLEAIRNLKILLLKPEEIMLRYGDIRNSTAIVKI